MGLTQSPAGGGTTLTDSASLRAAISDETGTGAAVFANTPTLVTPVIGAATGTSLALSGIATFGGTTSSFNGLKVSPWITGRLGVRLADDSDWGGLNCWTIDIFPQGNTSTRSINFNGNAPSFSLAAPGMIAWSNHATDSNQTKDIAITRNGIGIIEINNGTAISGASNAASIKALAFIAAGTATSCTGATIGTGSKNNAGFVTATTTGVSTIVVTFSVTAPTGWVIVASNETTANLIRQTARSTTTATLSGTTVTGDEITYIAMPF